ncbi:hypothetical protein COO60DRAFT_1640552 [Scenedesmus sp. NREL 46B-D3]|nr:hypothetical protein COO60DRAFT_1640552 [Scenedesmus sp. NREL 46B-D3]
MKEAELQQQSSDSYSSSGNSSNASSNSSKQLPRLQPNHAEAQQQLHCNRRQQQQQQHSLGRYRPLSHLMARAYLQLLQQQLAPLGEHEAQQAAADAAAGAAMAGTGGSSKAQLDQRVQDLIDEYQQLHLQLQQEDAAQQEGSSAAGAEAASASGDDAVSDASRVFLSVSGGGSSAASVQEQQGGGSAAAAAGRRSSSSGDGSGSGGSSAVQPKLRSRASKPKFAQRLSTSSGSGSGSGSGTTSRAAAVPAAAAAAAAEQADGAEDGEEATSRLVELPAPEALSQPNSTALAAVWWPFCFDTPPPPPAAAPDGLTPAAAVDGPATALEGLAARPYQALPTLKAPWWAPAAGGGHKLQRCYSRRLLDAAEAGSLLSVGRLALSGSGVVWPLLMPVHDALRDAYWGWLNGSSTQSRCGLGELGEGCAENGAADVLECGGIVHGCSVLFTTDSIHISRLPRHLTRPQQQLAVFADQLGPHSPAAAAACLEALGRAALPLPHPPPLLPLPLHRRGFRAAQGLGFGNQGLNPADDDDEDDVEWDADAPWHPWAQHRDPIKALELDVHQRRWQGPAATGSRRGAAVPLPVSTAGMQQLLGDAAGGDHWLLHVAQHGFSSSPLRQGRLGMRSADRHRRHVSVAAAGADWLWNIELAAAVLQKGGRLSGGSINKRWAAPAAAAAAQPTAACTAARLAWARLLGAFGSMERCQQAHAAGPRPHSQVVVVGCQHLLGGDRHAGGAARQPEQALQACKQQAAAHAADAGKVRLATAALGYTS